MTVLVFKKSINTSGTASSTTSHLTFTHLYNTSVQDGATRGQTKGVANLASTLDV
jgi:hypothetical protein